MSRAVEIVYSEDGEKGTYEVHRRVSDRDDVWVSFPGSQHEVWGWDELIALKGALTQFFANEERPRKDEED